jgi:excisionase family DNA binding protein
MSTVEEYKTVSQVAKILRISTQRVRQLIKDKQIPAEQVTKRLWVIPSKEFEKFRKKPRPDGVHKDKRAG